MRGLLEVGLTLIGATCAQGTPLRIAGGDLGWWAAQAPTAGQLYVDQLRREADQAERRRYLGVRPSEIAECRSRANSGLMPGYQREAVLDDCLAARRLRRQGR